MDESELELKFAAPGATPDAPGGPASPPGTAMLPLFRPGQQIISDDEPARRRKPGRPPGVKNAVAARAKTPAEKKSIDVSSGELAKMVIHLAVGGMSSVVGDEWQPESKDEADTLHAALSAYLASKGQDKLTPETMLLLVLAGYSAPRFKHQNTRDKLGSAWGRVVSTVRGWFKR